MMKSKHRKLIAIGGTAEVYDWNPGWVLKLYFDCFGPQMADYEHRIATAICATGLSTPAVGEIVNVDGRVGLLYAVCRTRKSSIWANGIDGRSACQLVRTA